MARQFDLASPLTGFTSALHKVGGTLALDAEARRNPGEPKAQGKLEWKDGLWGSPASGVPPDACWPATNDRTSLDDLQAYTGVRLAEGKRARTWAAGLWTLKLTAEANAFPVFTDDQLLATVTARQADANRRGGARRAGTRCTSPRRIWNCRPSRGAICRASSDGRHRPAEERQAGGSEAGEAAGRGHDAQAGSVEALRSRRASRCRFFWCSMPPRTSG